MINLDMIGRLNEERQLQVGGIGTSPGFRALLDSINGHLWIQYEILQRRIRTFRPCCILRQRYSGTIYLHGSSPRLPYSWRSFGCHQSGRQPRKSCYLLTEMANALANQQEQIAFTEAGPKVRGSSRGRRGGITLGLMPDVTYDGSDGMPVMFVTEGKPAQLVAFKKGILMVSIEGKNVGNVYDYMSRLGAVKRGHGHCCHSEAGRRSNRPGY